MTFRKLRELTVKLYADRVEIYFGIKLIAKHERSYERKRDLFEPLHYVPLLASKPGLLDHGKPFAEWKLLEVFERFRRELNRKMERGDREYIRILLLHQRFGTEEIAEALKRAERLGCCNADAVQLLLSSKEEDWSACRMQYGGAEVSVKPVDLGKYNSLMEASR